MFKKTRENLRRFRQIFLQRLKGNSSLRNSWSNVSSNILSATKALRYSQQRVGAVVSRVAFSKGRRSLGILAGALGAVTFFGWKLLSKPLIAEDDSKANIFHKAGKMRPDLPNYTREDVSKHKTKETRIWVTYKDGVYDITDFVESHPGGDKILLAAGSAIDPYWALYRQHLVENVLEMLEDMRIGNYIHDQQDLIDMSDPFAHDPERLPLFIVRSSKPFNAETPPELLTESMITPNAFFYIRNHLPVPVVDPNEYTLEISGENMEKPLRLTLNDLKTKFQHHTVLATIQCAGNRRNEMSRVKEVKGLEWDIGAIGTATWTGVKLRDLLIYAGLDPNNLQGLEHVQFEGLDKDFERNYGASIPISKAIDPNGDVLLAFQMNGEELPRDHGYPLRVVVPGVVGARSVKWVHKIHLSKEESKSHWQQYDYKGFSPSVDWSNVDYSKAPSIQELPVQSAITVPKNNSYLPEDSDTIEVKGYAWSGGGRGIVRVDLSMDEGRTWHNAHLQPPNQSYNRVWAWTLFSASLPIPAECKSKECDIICKAVDSAYNTQPETVAPIWNIRGVLTNSWHRVRVKPPPSNESETKKL
jgi:sulfite oxidase